MDELRGRPVREDGLASPEPLSIQDALLVELTLPQQGQSLGQCLPASASADADPTGDSVGLTIDTACNRTPTNCREANGASTPEGRTSNTQTVGSPRQHPGSVQVNFCTQTRRSTAVPTKRGTRDVLKRARVTQAQRRRGRSSLELSWSPTVSPDKPSVKRRRTDRSVSRKGERLPAVGRAPVD